ncbi:hypothetical protein LJR143_000099 [Pseudoxanthomonas sp. LjRoot143]|uniref:hypothetical protein n=1 Tax=Pseudoxanthomonas sp. LjRoot143 TaxID=3342266 RepID=UPI003ECC51FF
MRRKVAWAVTFMALASPASAQQAPWAELSGELLRMVDSNRASIEVIAVDGSTNFQTRSGYTHLSPGLHVLHLTWTYRGDRGEVHYGTFQFVLAPCTRYHVVADHGPATRAKRWELVIVKEEPIKRCKDLFPDKAPESAPSASADPVS